MRLIALALCSLLGIPAPAAKAPSRWRRVSAIPKTLNIRLYLRNGRVLKGAIRETTPGGLAFVEGRNLIHIDREDIAKITTMSRLDGALLGGLFGFAVAAGFCAVTGAYIFGPAAADRLSGLVSCGGLASAVLGIAGAAAGYERTLYTPQRAPKAAAAALR